MQKCNITTKTVQLKSQYPKGKTAFCCRGPLQASLTAPQPGSKKWILLEQIGMSWLRAEKETNVHMRLNIYFDTHLSVCVCVDRHLQG